ncbi:MAG: hypothetical protein HXS54_06305 [Theionarchaea archaeon]|nr:hypothetical protein [Theionarchaea archaeon]DBA34871.1 TPA_asm: hypothetical protein vir521_00077 [Caudoviricetes sp. vir521]
MNRQKNKVEFNGGACPACGGQLLRNGFRHNLCEIVRRYKCKACGKIFSPRKYPRTNFPARIIDDALELIQEVSYAEVSRKLGVSLTSLHSWEEKYSTDEEKYEEVSK